MKDIPATSLDYRKANKQVFLFVVKNRIILTSLLVLGIGVLASTRITTLTNPEVDTAHLAEQLTTIQSVQFDQDAIERITKLRDSNIDIESNFTDRNNPFNE